MLLECKDFYETETSFLSKELNYRDLELNKAKLVIKAHEKEISTLYNNLIIAKIHRDNNCSYPFSKVDFLSHKLQEIIYPHCVPKIYFGIFDNQENPYFVLERVPLDKLHKAYNIKRQKYHQANEKTYYFEEDFFALSPNDNIDELAKEHNIKVTNMQHEYADFVNKYGIAFDHSHANITWNEDIPVSLEVHKCRRDYLFNYDNCLRYIEGLPNDKEHKKDALAIIYRIAELL